MNISAARPAIHKTNPSVRVQSGAVYGLIIILALVAFEIFNFSTTVFALQDLLGDLKFAGVSWSTFLAVAFCGIDFAGIARLINQDNHSPLKESWYLFGAWLLAATANAALTWWGVAVAISNHLPESASVISTNTLTHIVPVFIAILVWVIRILIIASLTSAIERLMAAKKNPAAQPFQTNSAKPAGSMPHSQQRVPQPLNLTRIQKNPGAVNNDPAYQGLFSQRSFSEPHSNHEQRR